MSSSFVLTTSPSSAATLGGGVAASVVGRRGAMENRRGLGVEARANSGRVEEVSVSKATSSATVEEGGRLNREIRGLSEAGLMSNSNQSQPLQKQ